MMIGLIDQVTATHVGGWVRASKVPGKGFLRLRANGLIVGLTPSVTEATEAQETIDGLRCFRFTFEITEKIHQLRECEVEVIGPDGRTFAPGPIMFDPGEIKDKKTWALADIDTNIRDLIERTGSTEELYREIKYFSGWFGLAIDRAFALRDHETRRTESLRNALNNYGDLGGALGHLYGVVQTRYAEVKLPRADNPVVSIVIPVHNKFDLTYNCIASIRNHLGSVSFEVIVVDDLSSDETLLASVIFAGSVRIVRNSSNLGFVGSCNAGADAASGKYLFFLNNDTLVDTDTWLDALVATFSDVDDAGIVGSRLLFGDGKLQECGGIIWRDSSGWNWGRGGNPDDPKYRYRREVDYVSGAALMILKELFFEIGGFDKLYAPAYYEDTDLCFRVRDRGRKVLVQPASTIIHLEGQSAGTDTSSGMKRYQVVNRTKFHERWKHVLAKHQPNAVDPQAAAERYVDKTVLFVDDSVLTPDRDAGSNAALQHIFSLQRLGFKVIFIPSDNMAEIPPYTQQLEAFGVECIYAPHYWSVEDFLRRDGRSFDMIYLHRFSNADKYMNLCRSARPSAVVVYNVADLHSLRDQRGAELVKAGAAFASEDCVDSKRELDLIGNADVTIVHSSFEKDYLAAERPSAQVVVVPWAVQSARDVTPFSERRSMAFLGGYRHKPNVDAVLWYLKSVHPLLRARVPDINFLIVGSHMPDDFKNLNIPGAEPVGFVQDIDTFVSNLKLTIAPLRYGAGVKGKVLTSLAQGTPCVMTPTAAEGLDLPDSLSRFVAAQPEALVEAILSLWDNERLWESACWDGIDHIDSCFSRERVDERMGAVVAFGTERRLRSA